MCQILHSISKKCPWPSKLASYIRYNYYLQPLEACPRSIFVLSFSSPLNHPLYTRIPQYSQLVVCDVGELNTAPAKALLAPSYFAINLHSVVVIAKIDQEAEAQYVGQTKSAPR